MIFDKKYEKNAEYNIFANLKREIDSWQKPNSSLTNACLIWELEVSILNKLLTLYRGRNRNSIMNR